MRTCPHCDTPLAADQRYCLGCGRRHGEPRVPWRAALGTAAPVAARPTTAGRPAGSVPRSRGRMPTPRTAAALTLVMLGFGVVVGAAAGPRVPDTLAAGRGPLTVLLPPAAASAPSAAPASEPPAADPAPVPAPADELVADAPAETPVPAAVPAPAPADEPLAGDQPAPAPRVPQPRHVILLSLGPVAVQRVPYLAELAATGALLSRFRAVDDGELANQVALLAGQLPTPQTQVNCPAYVPVEPGTVDDRGRAQGEGCVYSPQVYTLADQLAAAGRPWKAYVEGQDAARGTCRRPAEGQPDPFHAPRPDDPYVTWRNPFVYFQTITSSPDCATSDVGLDALAADLATEDAPALAWVSPSVCRDGREAPCAPGAPAGPAALDAWLREWVPVILASKAFADDGMLIVVPSGPAPPPPAAAPPAAPPEPPGAGTAPSPSPSPQADPRRTGALVVADWVRPGAVVTREYDQLSLLKSLGELFSLRPLGAAQDRKVRAFGADVWARFKATP